MDLKRLKELLSFMDEHKLIELELEEEGKKVKLKKASFPSDAPMPVIVPSFQQSQTNQIQSEPKSTEPAKQENFIEIKAPMVGTFYRSPAPNATPFVELGKKIKADDVLCIIEAMKLMNEIKSEVRGEVIAIKVENGEPVEYGQVLFIIKPETDV